MNNNIIKQIDEFIIKQKYKKYLPYGQKSPDGQQVFISRRGKTYYWAGSTAGSSERQKTKMESYKSDVAIKPTKLAQRAGYKDVELVKTGKGYFYWSGGIADYLNDASVDFKSLKRGGSPKEWLDGLEKKIKDEFGYKLGQVKTVEKLKQLDKKQGHTHWD